MATYYSSTNNQRDSTPVLYVREHFPNSYTESPALTPGNMLMYANYASSSASYSDTLAVNPEPQHSCLEIPPVGPSDSTHPQQEILSHLAESRINYNGSWRDERDEMSFMNPTVAQNQGLSLSLSTQIQFRNPSSSFSSFLSPHMAVATEDENSMNKQSSNTQYFPPSFPGGSQDSYGMSNIARAVPNSKYLKAAQQLLDEVVNVRRALKPTDFEKKMWKEGNGRVKNGVASPSVSGGPSNPKDGNSHCEISAAERQDLQNKLTKLLSMLDEVDRRYKQYYHQMQIVVSSFDVISGCGAAKPYTALALQTISRHFRCLRDAITGQIRVTRKNLGEQDVSTNGKGVGISRLRYVDQQLRQQRAIQQLGMIQQHTWRPQRGLPETSVSILRAWLFEHFLHPYPKDSDKIMLARQTGLTRSQVSNWFINARVRLWKPMVEEMYKEEIGDAEMDSNSSSENASKPTRTDPQPSEERVQDVQQQSTTSTACGAQFFDSRSDHIPSSEMSSAFQDRTHRGTDAEYGAVKYRGGSERLMAAATAYQMPELGSFGNGGGVSLTLGLQHCEGVGLPMPGGAHHGLVTMRRGEDVYSASASSAMPERVDFDCIDPGDVQPRFSSSHLLHDFVA